MTMNLLELQINLVQEGFVFKMSSSKIIMSFSLSRNCILKTKTFALPVSVPQAQIYDHLLDLKAEIIKDELSGPVFPEFYGGVPNL